MADSEKEKWRKVDKYIEDLFIGEDKILEDTLALCRHEGLPDIHISKAQGKFLQILIQTKSAERVLEIGTLGGFSTLMMSRVLPKEGKLISLEVNPQFANIARQNISNAHLDNIVEIIEGEALQSLKHLKSMGVSPFDFIFIDADKENNPIYLAYALDLSKVGTIILIDNTVREGEIINSDSHDSKIIATRRLHELIKNNPRLYATTIQTVGAKGYDGFTMALVQDEQ